LAQKGLSMLHRADCSMVWSSFLLDKKNKWLSYNLWFIYIHFYKSIFFFNFSISSKNLLLNYYYKRNFLLLKKKKISFKLSKTKPRFSYYTDLYCIEFFSQLILLNLYFFTNLAFYKKNNTYELHDNDALNYDNKNGFEQDTYSTLKKKNLFLYDRFF
jgi:hypothetical protein